jgi:hypothetical protein
LLKTWQNVVFIVDVGMILILLETCPRNFSTVSDFTISPVVGLEVLTAASMQMAVFWIVAPCSLVEVYQRFRGTCCLHHQGTHSSPWWWRQQVPLKRWYTSTRIHGATTQKTAIFISPAVWNIIFLVCSLRI